MTLARVNKVAPRVQARQLLSGLDVQLRSGRPFRLGTPGCRPFGLELLTRSARIQVPHLIRVAADGVGNASCCMLCATVSEARFAPGQHALPRQRCLSTEAPPSTRCA